MLVRRPERADVARLTFPTLRARRDARGAPPAGNR
jgi:hypothetical protein